MTIRDPYDLMYNWLDLGLNVKCSKLRHSSSSKIQESNTYYFTTRYHTRLKLIFSKLPKLSVRDFNLYQLSAQIY